MLFTDPSSMYSRKTIFVMLGLDPSISCFPVSLENQDTRVKPEYDDTVMNEVIWL